MSASAGCNRPKVIHTIGHSTRTLEVFIRLLQAHHVQLLIDVRRWPASKRFPHFHRDRLAPSLSAGGIEYVWRGDLGGFRKPLPESPNQGWRVATFRAYADFMLTSEFATILSEVLSLAETQRTAIMCAEAVPWRCHRQLLADAFMVRGWTVRHILEGDCQEHRLTSFARPEADRIVYPSSPPAQSKLPGTF